MKGWKSKPSGRSVSITWRLQELIAAKEFGLTPAQWKNEPKWSRAEMIAFTEVIGNIKAYQYERDKDEIDSGS